MRRLVRRVFDPPEGLEMSGFRLIRREVVEHIKAYRTSFPYLSGMILSTTHRVANAEVRHEERRYGRSGYTLPKLIRLSFNLLINYSALPLKAIGWVGMGASLVAFVAGAVFTTRQLLVGRAPAGWTSLAVLVSLFSGALFAMMFVMAEYLSRLLTEVSRPPAARRQGDPGVKPPLVVVGGHGSGEIAMAVFEAANEIREQWEIAGFLSDVCPPGERLGKHPVLGGTAEVEDFVDRGFLIHYTLHLNAKKKQERVEKLRSLRLPPEAHASAVHPRAHLEPSTELGPGVVVCAQAATSFGVRLGGFIHMYTNAFAGHDATVADYATLAAHSVLGARVRAGEGCHVGLNSSVREDVSLGEYSIVGMGAVVLGNVAPTRDRGRQPGPPAGASRAAHDRRACRLGDPGGYEVLGPDGGPSLALRPNDWETRFFARRFGTLEVDGAGLAALPAPVREEAVDLAVAAADEAGYQLVQAWLEVARPEGGSGPRRSRLPPGGRPHGVPHPAGSAPASVASILRSARPAWPGKATGTPCYGPGPRGASPPTPDLHSRYKDPAYFTPEETARWFAAWVENGLADPGTLVACGGSMKGPVAFFGFARRGEMRRTAPLPDHLMGAAPRGAGAQGAGLPADHVVRCPARSTSSGCAAVTQLDNGP